MQGNSMPGDKLLAKIKQLEQEGVKFTHIQTKEGGDQYRTETSNYTLELYINPKKWLGLTFTYVYNNQKSLSYGIDTDLYPIDQAKYQDFAAEIENDILDFMKSLYSNKILVGTIKTKPAIVIPLEDSFYTVVKRLLGTTGRTWTAEEFQKLRKSLKPLSAGE